MFLLKGKYYFLLTLFVLFAFSCKEVTDIPDNGFTGNLFIQFKHQINNDSLKLNQLIYSNAAGNQYEVSEIKYFISDLVFYRHNAASFNLNHTSNIHYVDIGISNTLLWNINEGIPVGNYDSITFIFGLNDIRNQSNIFINPPEVNMFWPEVLGGGYHYMMLNGKWKSTDNQIKPFNFHLGKGQIYSGTTTSTDSIIAFVHNYLKVSLATPNLKISTSQTTILTLSMDINSWFDTPNVYNHNFWGGHIMQNQAALHTAKENGFDVFSIKN